MEINIHDENSVYEHVKNMNLSMNEYIGMLINLDMARNSDALPNFVGRLSPEEVAMMDDYYRAERCVHIIDDALPSMNDEKLAAEYRESNKKSKEHMYQVELYLGRKVANELRNTIFKSV